MTGPSGVFVMAPTRQTETQAGSRPGRPCTRTKRRAGRRGGGGVPAGGLVLAELVPPPACLDAQLAADAERRVGENGFRDHIGSFSFPSAAATLLPASGGQCHATSETIWTPGSRATWLSLVIGISTNRLLQLMPWTKNVASCEKGLTDGCISRNPDAKGRATTRGIA